MTKHHILPVLSEIFGPGCPSGFRSALPKQVAKDALLVALKSPEGRKASTRLVGEIERDDLRIQCVIHGDGFVKREYTTFIGCINDIDGGCEVVGSYVVPFHGKVIMTVIVLATFVFAVLDLIDSVSSHAEVLQMLRGPIIFVLAVVLTPYLFGVNTQQIDEISAGISRALGIVD